MSFDAIRDKIFPWIKVKLADSRNADDGEAIPVSLVTREFLGDLIITYAVDEGEHFSLLQHGEVPEDIGPDELYALACKNMADQVEFNFTGTSYGGYGILAGGDHETGALCLDFIWDFCAREIGKDLVIAVPAKDCLFMAVADDAEQVEAMKAISKDIFEHGERVLSNTLLLFHADTRDFSVYGTL